MRTRVAGNREVEVVVPSPLEFLSRSGRGGGFFLGVCMYVYMYIYIPRYPRAASATSHFSPLPQASLSRELSHHAHDGRPRSLGILISIGIVRIRVV
jgi:hypothetical protein